MFLLTHYTYNGFVAPTRVTIQYGTLPPTITTAVFKRWGRGFVDVFLQTLEKYPFKKARI